MFGIIALILIAIAVVAVLSFAAHILFSPLVLVALGILVWLKLRPRRSHQYPRITRCRPGSHGAQYGHRTRDGSLIV